MIRPILGQPAFSIVMLTIGIGYVARGLITMIPAIGTETHTLPVPYKDQVWNVGGLVLNVEQMVVIAATAVLCAVLFAMFRYSKVGIAMQAASQNQLAAYYMGIPVKRLNGLVWGLAAAVAAIAGLLLAPITFVHANMGFIGLKAFPAAVVGGFGSLPGAIVGGLIIGIVESLSGFYLPEGFKDIARLHRGAAHAGGDAERPVRREAAQEGLNGPRMRFLFKTDYEQDIAPRQAWRPRVLVRRCCWCCCWPRPGSLSEYLLAQLTFILIYGVVGLGLMLLAGFTGLFSHRPCRVPRRRRVHAGRAHRTPAGRSRWRWRRRRRCRPPSASWSACPRCA